jgi:short subunit dehydrogenase-like uncharacterized protein
MIYGASGYAGGLVAREAIALGERPLLAGRSAERIQHVAEELGLPWVSFDLGDHAAAVDALRGVELVLLAAGPFDGLAQRMMDACLEAGTHYADLDNEVPVFRAAQERDARARERGVSVVPGVGFGTIATGSLVKRVVAELPDATRLECGRGEKVEARLETGEGFAFTAAAAARAVAVIRRAPTAGAHAAATVLGGTFVDSLPGVRVTLGSTRSRPFDASHGGAS